MLRLALTAPLRCSNLQLKSSTVRIPNQFRPTNLISRQFGNDSRQSSRKVVQRQSPTLKERAMAPAGPNAYSLGKGFAAGAAVIGMGALCFYGLGLGKGTNIMENSMLWPEHVKQRIHTTYAYFGGSIVITTAAAIGVFRSPRLLHLVTQNGWMSMLGTLALMMGSGMLCQSIPYSEGLGTKQLAWATHCAIIGAVVAPLCFLGGPLLTRAALYTGGIVGGLSTVAVCAPSDKFLYMGGPLAIGLGAVFASSLASMWLPPTTALGAGLASLSLYGGLVLFSGFLLYDTQRIVRAAETHPTMYTERPYDPINKSLSIYMDTINIFIRIATILAGGGGNRRK